MKSCDECNGVNSHENSFAGSDLLAVHFGVILYVVKASPKV